MSFAVLFLKLLRLDWTEDVLGGDPQVSEQLAAEQVLVTLNQCKIRKFKEGHLYIILVALTLYLWRLSKTSYQLICFGSALFRRVRQKKLAIFHQDNSEYIQHNYLKKNGNTIAG